MNSIKSINNNIDIYFSSIIKLIDLKRFDFCDVYSKINKINSNNEKKEEIDHFISIAFGKLAELFVFKRLKEELNLTEKDFVFSKMDSFGHEIADLILKNKQQKEFKIEIRSSFQKHIHDNLHQIIRYFNNYKKVEDFKDFYFQIFFNENKQLVKNKIRPLFEQFIFYFNEKKVNHDLKFSDFLIKNGFEWNIKDENLFIANLSIYSFLSKDMIFNNNILKVKNLTSNTSFEVVQLKDTKNFATAIDVIKNEINNDILSQQYKRFKI